MNIRVRNVIIRMIVSIIIFVYISYLAWNSDLPRDDFFILIAFFALFLGWSIIETLIYKDPDTLVIEDDDRRSYLFLQLSSFLALFYALIDFLDYHFTRMSNLEPGVIYLGFLIFILNAILRYHAITTLGKYYNPRVAVYQEHSLVTDGIYKKIRHPMYLSALLNVLAIALIFSSWGALVIMLFAVLPAVIYRINIEEEVLLTHLGSEYRQYLDNSKKMIPGIW